MTSLLSTARDDDLIRPPHSLQSRFIHDTDDMFAEPLSDYFGDAAAEYSATTTSKLNFRPPLISPVYTPTLSSLSSEVTSDAEGDEVALPAFEAEDELTPEHPRETVEEEATSDDSGLTTPRTTQEAPTATPDLVLRNSSDDASIESEPERHVDYLSHDWEEEDIWSSWRYVAARKGRYSNGVRLENASWRTWAKAKYGLRTISPETLNWLKDCDVTWLYGPLQTDNKKESQKPPPPSGLSSTNSFLDRKSILKKKTASEAILQRSLSQHTLLKHAGAILQAQNAENSSRSKPAFERATSDMGVPLARIREYPFNNTSSKLCTPSDSASSGLASPSERRHIHFNNEVVQCIAVEAKDDEEENEHDVDPSLFFLGEEYSNEYDEYDDSGHTYPGSYVNYNGDDDTESDEGVVMMKNVSSRSTSTGTAATSVSASSRSTPRIGTTGESKTIAPLPPTTLKCRSDTPELPWASGQEGTRQLSPTPSLETLRPRRPEANFLLDGEDEDDDEAEGDSFWNLNSSSSRRRHAYDYSHDRPWFVNSKDRDELGVADQYKGNRNKDGDNQSGSLHLTPSGMFMPYQEGEDVPYTGVFGRIVDTVNTARDIAHVIWNVGWRK